MSADSEPSSDERGKGMKEGSQTSLDDLSKQQKEGLVVISAFLIGGVIGASLNPTDVVMGFFVYGGILAGIAWLVGTESGREYMEQDDKMQQQQQTVIGKSSESKVVCNECGWKNPKSNNFCHDCGTELSP